MMKYEDMDTPKVVGYRYTSSEDDEMNKSDGYQGPHTNAEETYIVEFRARGHGEVIKVIVDQANYDDVCQQVREGHRLIDFTSIGNIDVNIDKNEYPVILMAAKSDMVELVNKLNAIYQEEVNHKKAQIYSQESNVTACGSLSNRAANMSHVSLVNLLF
jgi:hypothetical protein